MSKYKAIMFDMDGTLLPMDMQKFTRGYFAFLAEKVNANGFNITAEALEDGIWKGTYAMMKNDGSRTNREVFFDVFGQVSGITDPHFEDVCDDFYAHEFERSKQFTWENPLAKEAVRAAHEKAAHVILATNPIFPRTAQLVRLGFTGLGENDFEIVTDYETGRYCKPNHLYLLELAQRAGVKPEECILIGNDEYEDMDCARRAGMDGYLVTDCGVIRREKCPWTGMQGTFEEMTDMLRQL